MVVICILVLDSLVYLDKGRVNSLIYITEIIFIVCGVFWCVVKFYKKYLGVVYLFIDSCVVSWAIIINY